MQTVFRNQNYFVSATVPPFFIVWLYGSTFILILAPSPHFFWLWLQLHLFLSFAPALSPAPALYCLFKKLYFLKTTLKLNFKSMTKFLKSG